MKKANIITVHVGANFGSNLQAIATCKLLERFDIAPRIINYVPYRVTWKGYFDFSGGILGLIRKLYSAPNKWLNDKIYNSFLKKHANVSKAIYPWDSFAKMCPQADYYVTGSDQVWNSKYNGGVDERYFWKGIVGKKISYAASMGNDSLTEEEKKSFADLLKDYSAISVREKSAQVALAEINIKSSHVLDPTIMLDKDQWKCYATKRKIKDPYLLVYLPYNTVDVNLAYRTIRKIAKRKNLKVVSFSWHYWADKLADETIRYANPGDFLSLMIHADYVVTNSFHGTAFSINLNKQFCVYLPSSFSTRILSLLQLCNIENHLLNEEIIDAQIDERIDYEKVNSILKDEREKSFNFLAEALQ